jgi:hypothetical protein
LLAEAKELLNELGDGELAQIVAVLQKAQLRQKLALNERINGYIEKMRVGQI